MPDHNRRPLKYASVADLCLPHAPPSSSACVWQEIKNLHNEQLMGIRREEEMEMSDDDMEDAPDSKDSEDSGRDVSALSGSARLCQRRARRLALMVMSVGGRAARAA